MHILIVVGVRPQFVKLGVLLPSIETAHRITVVHTGQHWDDRLAGQIFRDFDLDPPETILHVREDSRIRRLAASIDGLEPFLASARDRPDLVLVIGDSDPALAGAVGAALIGVPIAHAEAGLRSGDWRQVEERNRACIDALASLHFAPTMRCKRNLSRENHTDAAMTGDLHLDAVRKIAPYVAQLAPVCLELGCQPQEYALITIHRSENLRQRDRLRSFLGQIAKIDMPCIWPLHPAAWSAIVSAGFESGVRALSRVTLVEPQSYSRLLSLATSSSVIITDSGGLQREAYFVGRPCVVVRESTEFPETIDCGAATLTPIESESLSEDLGALLQSAHGFTNVSEFGDGHAALLIRDRLSEFERSIDSISARYD